MLTDAHVHMGYFPRFCRKELEYYSPRRIIGVLNRCGVEEFIVSSTCAQIGEIGIDAIIREAKEMKRLAGDCAHIFFWLSWHLFQEDASLSWLDYGIFEGVKFHEKETPWFACRQMELRRILDKISERGLPVQFHTGDDDGCRPSELVQLARDYPTVRFDLAHCRLPGQSAAAVAECPNVYVDTGFHDADFSTLRTFDWKGRLLYGSDLPVWQAYRDVALTAFYRKNLHGFHQAFPEESGAFHEFLKGKRDPNKSEGFEASARGGEDLEKSNEREK